jgi:hypothetical protein
MPSDLLDATRMSEPRIVAAHPSTPVVSSPPVRDPADEIQSPPMRGIAVGVMISMPFWSLLALLAWVLM